MFCFVQYIILPTLFSLVVIIFIILFTFAMNINSEAAPLLLMTTWVWLAYIIVLVAVIYHFLLIIPTISVIVRRLHDTNRSGWSILWLYILPSSLLYFAASLYVKTGLTIFYLLQAIAAILLLYFIYIMGSAGTNGENYYGDDPLNEEVL